MMTVASIRKTLISFVNQRAKIAALGKQRPKAIDKIRKHLDYLKNCDREFSWAAMVVNLTPDILSLVPPGDTKYKNQRDEIFEIIRQSEATLKAGKKV